MPRIPDPVEAAFQTLCEDMGIRYVKPEENPSYSGVLDFFLPDYGLHVECKSYSCERLHPQLVRNKADAGPTLIIIGASGVAALRNLITDIEENARNDFRAGEECS